MSAYFVRDTFTDTAGTAIDAHVPDTYPVGFAWQAAGIVIDATGTKAVPSDFTADVNSPGTGFNEPLTKPFTFAAELRHQAFSANSETWVESPFGSSYFGIRSKCSADGLQNCCRVYIYNGDTATYYEGGTAFAIGLVPASYVASLLVTDTDITITVNGVVTDSAVAFTFVDTTVNTAVDITIGFVAGTLGGTDSFISSIGVTEDAVAAKRMQIYHNA